MEKLHVGFFIDTFYPMVDGVINVVDSLATQLLDKCDVTVFTLDGCKGKHDTKEHPYEVVKCKSMPIWFLDYNLPLPSLDRQFKKSLKNSKLDIVYFHSPMFVSKQGIKYAKRHHIPIISHLHSQFKQDFYKATKSEFLTGVLLRNIMRIFNKSNCAVAVNSFTRDLFVNDYKLKTPVRVIRNATHMIPCEDYDAVCAEVNEKYKLTPDQKIFIYVGRLNTLKNVDTILEACALLRPKYDNFKLLLVGSGNDESHFRWQTAKLNLYSRVIFVKKIDDRAELAKIYARADLLLFPSHYDTDGLVRFEAASQGTPCVVTKGTGAASIIEDGVTGFVAEDTTESFAEKIYTAVTDEELYKKVSENVRTQLYRTWHDSAGELYQLITEMLEQKEQERAAKEQRKKKHANQ